MRPPFHSILTSAEIDAIERRVAARPGCTLYAPDLCEAAGLDERAAVARRRFALLQNNARMS
jgi:hypothetical protein